MSVSAHLGVDLAEYDARIRTFIPHYDRMLAVAASEVPASARRIVDLGIGTGALAARCLRRASGAAVLGIDADPEIAEIARVRLGKRVSLRTGSFLRQPLPASDVVVASFALHHVRTRAAKRSLYLRIRQSLRPGGQVITVDCHPSSDARDRKDEFARWRQHLCRRYTRRQASGLMARWAREDVYVPLAGELRLLEQAGLAPRVVWRRGAFTVIAARRA